MANYNCCCRFSCTGASIIGSILVGVITAFLTFMAVITLTPAFLWVVLGIAIVYLGVNLVVGVISADSAKRCLCPNSTAWIIGVLGSVLFSLILLAISFAATSVIGAIFSGALLTFFSLLITATACNIRCVICDD